jgi:hypothetical protein
MATSKFKERWVCFTCRKMFRVLRQVDDPKPGVKPESPERICPECGTAMVNIGGFFAPPPRSDLRRREAASLVAAAGYHCHSLGASRLFWELVGPGRPNLREVAGRLAKAAS